MIIDIIFFVLLLIAILKGLQRGLIVSLFSVLACVLGLAAAIKLSTVVAGYLQHGVRSHSKWLPILAFILVFFGVVLLVRLLANLIEKAVDFAFMGWLNKLGGVILYVALYVAVYSVVLFYGSRSHIISASSIASSRLYSWIEPWGVGVVNAVGKIIPLFRNMFAALEQFFAGIA